MSKRAAKQTRTKQTATAKRDLRSRRGLSRTYMRNVVLEGTKIPAWDYYIIY